MSSQICLKLHLDSDILRVRAPVDKCRKVEEIRSYVEMAWPDLKKTPYHLYYTDDMDDACVLNQVSLPDALILAEKSRVPTMNIYVKTGEDEEDDVVVGDSLSRMVNQLVDFDMIPGRAAAQEFAEMLQAAGQDLDKVTDELVKSRVEKPSSEKHTSKKSLSKKSPTGKQLKPKSSVKIEREVSDETDAFDTMADLLTGLGFVDSKKAARDLLRKLVPSTDDLDKVSDHIERWAERQQREEKAYSEDDEDVAKGEERKNDKSGKPLATLLNDYGFVADEKSANELVEALEDTNQDVDKILYHFIHGPSKPVYNKPLPTPEERQAQEDAAAKRCVDKQVEKYEQKQRKAGRKMQPAEARWGWACPKHPRDPKADHIDLLC
ncbi:hypothetical protein FOZ60_000688 [Perkinsus olseni]|uniref:Uncharacterized protein n=1 Tax=Perkinsus olseni TaxID=32597 RepID=A0A7J6MXD9_PEROL|nr:hypothetical protein FOZ60_000688 [Perkinsus olseni]